MWKLDYITRFEKNFHEGLYEVCECPISQSPQRSLVLAEMCPVQWVTERVYYSDGKLSEGLGTRLVATL